MKSPLWVSILAAVIPAPLAVGAFLVVHNALISPVWTSAVRGVIETCIVAIAIGVAYHFIDGRRSPLLFGVALWAITAPAVMVAAMSPTGGLEVEMTGGILVVVLGALAGWLVARTRAAAISSAIAAIAVTFITAPSSSFLRVPRGRAIYAALLVLFVVYSLAMAALARAIMRVRR